MAIKYPSSPRHPSYCQNSKVPVRGYCLKFLQYLALSFNFFFKGVKLLDTFKSEALADARNILVLSIFQAFSSFSASMPRRLQVSFQNIF